MEPNVIIKQLNLLISKVIPSQKYTNILFIAGTGRSGTTWLTEMINHNNDFRVYFEPFYNKKVPQFSSMSYRPYYRPNQNSSKILDDINRLLRGKGLNSWITSRDRNPLAKKLIIKDIRANLMLGYLKKNFPDIRFILLIRHPIDVALSKMKLGWQTHLEVFLNQPALMEDHLQPFENMLKDAEDVFEKHVALWCVENFVPLRQFSPENLHVVFYENLISDPEGEVEKLYRYIDEPLDENIFQAADKRSSTDWNKDGSGHSAGERKYSAEQVEKYRKVTDVFGMSDLYGPDENPDHKAADKLLRTSSL